MKKKLGRSYTYFSVNMPRLLLKFDLFLAGAATITVRLLFEFNFFAAEVIVTSQIFRLVRDSAIIMVYISI